MADDLAKWSAAFAQPAWPGGATIPIRLARSPARMPSGLVVNCLATVPIAHLALCGQTVEQIGSMPRRPASPLRRWRAVPHQRVCEAPGCRLANDFRAPRARPPERVPLVLPLAHVRDLQHKKWDYFAGLDADQIEAHIRAGLRPGAVRSGPLGATAARSTGLTCIFRIRSTTCQRWASRYQAQTRWLGAATPAERATLGVLDLSWPLSQADVKSRYKGTGEAAPPRRQRRRARGRGEAETDQRRLFHIAVIPGGLPAGVIALLSGQPCAMVAYSTQSACDYEFCPVRRALFQTCDDGFRRPRPARTCRASRYQGLARQVSASTPTWVPAFSTATEHVPEVDDAYLFDS